MGMTNYKNLYFKKKYEKIINKKMKNQKIEMNKLSYRGRIVNGIIKSIKMNKTVIVKINYMKKLKKYNRFVKRHSNVPAHYENFEYDAKKIRKGDHAVIIECRPISKTKRFKVIKIIKRRKLRIKS